MKMIEDKINLLFMKDFFDQFLYKLLLWEGITDTHQRKNIESEFMMLLETNRYFKDQQNVNHRKTCDYCGSINLEYVNNGFYSCNDCIYVTSYSLDDQKFIEDCEFGAKPVTIGANQYQKFKYCTVYINKFQMKRIPDINDEILENIKRELTGYRPNPTLLRRTLKKLGYSRLYYDIPFLLNKLQGKVPPHISPEHEDHMRQMFNDIDSIWLQIKNTKRRSFINYSYCLYKILELLGDYDEFLDYFKISRTNIERLDRLWLAICNHLNWEFIPTHLS